MREIIVWAGVGGLGGLGALARYTVDSAVSARSMSRFPLGTLTVNLTGAFALGLLVGAGVGGDALSLLAVGLLGGYTTFSTWMVETEVLAAQRRLRLAWLNIAVPALAGLAAVSAGWGLAAALS